MLPRYTTLATIYWSFVATIYYYVATINYIYIATHISCHNIPCCHSKLHLFCHKRLLCCHNILHLYCHKIALCCHIYCMYIAKIYCNLVAAIVCCYKHDYCFCGQNWWTVCGHNNCYMVIIIVIWLIWQYGFQSKTMRIIQNVEKIHKKKRISLSDHADKLVSFVNRAQLTLVG